MLTIPLCFRERAAVGVCALVLVTAGALQAGSYNSGGFDDTDRFTAHELLAGQDGWLSAAGNLTTAYVRDGILNPPGSTGQTVEVYRGANQTGEWYVPNLTAPTVQHRHVVVEWRQYVEASPSNDNNFFGYGPMFGVLASNATQSSLSRLAGLFVDAYDGRILVPSAAAAGNTTLTNTSVALNAWNSFAIRLNFTGSGAAVSYYVNGSTQPFHTDNFAYANVGGANVSAFTDAAIYTAASSGDAASQAIDGYAYFDNYRVSHLLMGDANGDGVVNAADLRAVEKNLGNFGIGNHLGDANHDGRVDGQDLLLVERLYGQTSPLGASVPEPAAASLLIAALFVARRHVRS